MKPNFIYFLLATVLIFASACSKNNTPDAFQGSGTTGIGGSLARFTITNDHLYTVSDTKLSVFDITAAANPIKKNTIHIGLGVETIFPLDDKIFIGTQFGMSIVDVSQPTNPLILSSISHVRSCDPVVADDKYAYITLRSDNQCTRGVNELQVLDISVPERPTLLKTYTMNKPLGLALDGNNLFVCDNLIKWYDASDPKNLVSKGTFTTDATDLIAHEGILMVIGFGGLTQYSYDTGELKFLSRIPTTL